MLKKFFTIALSAVVALGCCACGKQNSSSSSPLKDGQWDVSGVSVAHIKSKKLIALTFDDGPHANTRDLIQVFNDFNAENPDWIAHATLFNIGNQFTPAYKLVLKSAFESGFEMANHTYSHVSLPTASDEEIAKEIDRTDALLKEIDGKDRHLIRPPGGNYNEHVLSLMPAPMIYWSNGLDTVDWQQTATEDSVYSCVVNNLRPGGIVLMHQKYEKSIQATRRLLPVLKNKGYQVVSVSELIKVYGYEVFQGSIYDEFN